MSYKITFDETKCVACGACAVACMDQNDIQAEEGQLPLRRTFTKESRLHPEETFGYYSHACEHCDDAPCIPACPSGCLFKDPDTGFTVFDTTNCIGCRSCAFACPHGAPTMGLDGKMLKCDGCSQRVKAGLLPACVAVCPFDALTLEESYNP